MKTDLKTILFQTFVMAMFSFSTRILSPVLSPYMKQLGVSDVQISLIFSLFPLVTLVFSPIIGRVSDKIGRRRIIFFGVVVEVMALVFYLADGLAFFVIAKILEALAFVSVSLIALASIQDSLPDSVRSRYSGISLSADYVGMMSGSLAGGFLADAFGIKSPFYAAILSMMLLAMLLYGKRSGEKIMLSGQDFDLIKDWKDFLSVKKLRGMAILGFFMHGKSDTISVFFPLFVIQTLGFSFKEVGVALFLFGGFHIFQFLIGPYIDRKAKEGVVLGGVVITAIATLAFAYSSDINLVYTFVFVHSVGAAFWNVSAWSLMSDIGEKKRMEGEVVGSYTSLAKIGAFFGLVINGFVVSLFGFRTLFSMYAVFTLVASAIAAYFFYSKGR